MTGNYSARIAADTVEGIYIKATAISASVGAWVRTRTDGIYDVKWFGAKGDNTTDDYVSIQAAINLCQYHSGGDVLFSQGGYLVGTGLTVSVPLVRLVGVGQKYCSIFTNTANISVVTVTAARCAIERLSLFQQVQCGIASAIVSFEAGAVQCTLDALDIVGGYYCFRALSGTADNLVTNCVMRLATGGAIAYVQGAGTVFFKRCLFNQDWVSGGSNPPAPANDRGARANSTAYGVKDFVTLGGFYLQCTTAGTSAGSAPSLTGKWYGQPITDGGAVFYMANNSAGVAVLVDSGCIYIEFEACDFTGAFNYGAQVANNLGTTAPDVVRFIRCTSEGTVLHNFFVSSVNRLLIADCEMKGGVGNSASNTGIYLSPSVAGDVTLRGNQIVSEDYGIWLDKSTTLGSALIEGNSVFGCTYGIYVSPAVKNFQIIGNNCGSSSNWGNNAAAITVAAGASDFYMIATNRVHGATLGVSDAGTGVNKVVSGLNV
jgi:parallel beta-helix repeat protein